MDTVVRTMANDEQIALFDSVVEMLQTDDAEALQAIMSDGFAALEQDYRLYDVRGLLNAAEEKGLEDMTPDASPFVGFRFNTNASFAGRTRTLEFVRNYEYATGDYRVEMVFSALGEAPFKLTWLSIYPILVDGQNHPGATSDDPAPVFDPI